MDDAQIMRDLLRLHGYDAILAEHATTARYLVLEQAPDLVLVDLEMPFMDGYEFVTALKSDPHTRHIPVVFLTRDDNVAVRSRKVGAEAYLNKPVTVDALLKVIGLFTYRIVGASQPIRQ